MTANNQNPPSPEAGRTPTASHGFGVQRLVRLVRIFVPVSAIILMRLPCVVMAGVVILAERAERLARAANEWLGHLTPGLDNYVQTLDGKWRWVTPAEKAAHAFEEQRQRRVAAARRFAGVGRSVPNTGGETQPPKTNQL